ncbi:ATP-binding protein [Brevibacillus fulvus]|uniref:DNA helicase HerA-like ATPase n=1 Tax=Brevibacillus fulvus TaxID=1125967 RepID=A0A938Y1Z9_9BACL|nr:DUF87 domain-containing protein [Brevibacillus fulvus]MBM7591845.1 DNA helicase HerA-like ATPase [Brevibacillus fulvus]
MQEQIIGRVISVDSFRVIIELDASVKTLYRSGFNDIYEIARINSYISIPVGAEKIIAMITRVKISDETEFEGSENSILLPKSKRYIIATMIGTINNSNKYIQGVYNFPILDNPVCYVLKQDLEIIFDHKPKGTVIDLRNDYFLPIGKSPTFSDFDIKINPDKFLNKHVAVLGNTGSGKSCTIASIFQSMFRGKFLTKDGLKTLTDAHVVIFDTNGEYKKAFQFKDEELKTRVNTFTITKEGLKVPYWFMNYDDFDYLFEPSHQTQAPIFKNAISLAKKYKKKQSNSSNSNNYSPIRTNYLKRIIEMLEDSKDFRLRSFIKEELEDDKLFIETKLPEYKEHIFKLEQAGSNLTKNGQYWNGSLNKEILEEVYEAITKIKGECDSIESEKENHFVNVDLPSYFNFFDLFNNYIDDAIMEIDHSDGKYREYLSSLKLRLSSFYNDDRISTPLMLKNDNISEALHYYLKYILGVLTEQYDNDFCEYRFNQSNVNNPEQKSQITIIDMSLLPYEVLENITGLIGRLLLEFVQRIEKVEEYEEFRGKYPIVIVLEEAQNYIPQVDRKKDRVSISKRVFERIAREGRKYGLSLIVSSQRPSELSKTILSQCNTFIVHRLQNPEDQSYVRQLVSSANADILSQLPILPQQHAIIMGDAVRSPVQVRLNDVVPKPDSDDPEFFSQWLGNSIDIDFKKVVKEWVSDESENGNQ